jgi:hypothetical protein
MEYTEARGLAGAVLDHVMPGNWHEMMPGFQYTDDGIVISSFSETRTLIGFGISSGLTPTTALLHEIADLNQRNKIGHVWLAPGADDEHWSLICGFKVVYLWHDAETFMQTIATIVNSHHALLDMCFEKLAPYGGSRYWDELDAVEPGARALVLLSHLG